MSSLEKTMYMVLLLVPTSDDSNIINNSRDSLLWVSPVEKFKENRYTT